MPSDQAFMEGYDSVELQLPNGETIRCKPLKLSESVKFLRLLDDVRKGETGAIVSILDEFPKALGQEEAFEELLPMEVLEVVGGFFAYRRQMNGTGNVPG